MKKHFVLSLTALMCVAVLTVFAFTSCKKSADATATDTSVTQTTAPPNLEKDDNYVEDPFPEEGVSSASGTSKSSKSSSSDLGAASKKKETSAAASGSGSSKKTDSKKTDATKSGGSGKSSKSSSDKKESASSKDDMRGVVTDENGDAWTAYY